ncbi:MAG: (deoxy)nucleoside triphosphate pyrophosphohydrolase [Clostridiales bacterium]|nr:(deoxy)nucleoside triphosphate pyrophosphohydrolase [Clostridiales bacterium]
MKILNVVGAILTYNNRILCAQRGAGKYEYVSYKYEFPGGKIEAGETPKEALHRELIEEMLVDIDIDDMSYYDSVEHDYPDFKLKMSTFVAPLEDQKITLTEHVDIKWLDPSELDSLDWAPADIPIVKKLMKE